MRSWPWWLGRLLCACLLLAAGLDCAPFVAWGAETMPAATEGDFLDSGRAAQELKQVRDFYQKTAAATTAAGARLEKTESGFQHYLWLGVLVVIVAGIAYLKLAPGLPEGLGRNLNPWPALSAAGAEASGGALEDDGPVSDFASAFRIGPRVAARMPDSGVDSLPGSCSSSSSSSCSAPFVSPAPKIDYEDEDEDEDEPVEQFLAVAPGQVQGLRQLLHDLGRDSNMADRQPMLGRLQRELQELKGKAGLPGLLPVWQLAFAVECLVKQLTDKPERVTPSTLRTVGAGIDLLQELCRPGLKPDLCTEPPLRWLAVDDDAISRHALALALGKALARPDLAIDGAEALELAAQQAYDVIFLDVQMAGMDGFELCSRIRAAGPNQTTPVVFVTMQSDFDARAKSTLVGGNDLLAKPFLIFEVAVKALTLALRRRLEQGDR